MLGQELHCVWDCRGIPEDRVRKGAITCGDECKRQYANYRRRVRAQGKCRLCGRGRRRTSKLDPVLMEHTGVCATLGTQMIDGKPDFTKLKEIDLAGLARRLRMQRIVFEAASEVYDRMTPKWKGGREYLLAHL
jgi:hypothetical protein